MRIEDIVKSLEPQMKEDKEYLWNNPEPRIKRDKNFYIY